MILINSSPKNSLKIFQPFLPIYVPVGIGCLLAVCEKEGIGCNYIDEQIEDNIISKAKEYVSRMEKPYIFGFSVLTAAFKSAIEVSIELKKSYPDSIIVFGGIHPSALPDECLSFDHIDFVVSGEAEETLIDLYRSIKNGDDFSHIPNLSYKKNGHVVHNKSNGIIKNLDNLPAFPYHLFDSPKYDLGFILSSRGCPYRCIFCSNRVTTGRKYRFKPAEVILEELELLLNKYKKNHILFVDDNLLVSKQRIYTLLEGIKKLGLDHKMTFSFQARGDNVNLQLLKDLYDTGFRSASFGIETASEDLMNVINKGETVAQCIEAVQMAKSVGFHVSSTFLYGLPGETHEDRLKCVELSRQLKLDMVKYNNVTPYPGTDIYESAKSEQRLNVQGLYENFNSVSTFIESPFKKIPFSYIPQGESEDSIRRDILFSYFSFYLDFNTLKKMFTRPDEGMSWFRAGSNIFELIKKIPAIIYMVFNMFIKFLQLFYLSVINRQTRISLRFFLKIFDGLRNRNGQVPIGLQNRNGPPNRWM